MELIPAGTWLSSIHPSLAGYEKAFIEYGYEDTQMLSAATPEDLANDFNEMGMKKNHHRLILKALSALSNASSTSSALPTLEPLERKTLVTATRGSKSGVKIEVSCGRTGTAVVTPPKRLQSYKSEHQDLLQADVANRLCEADLKRNEHVLSKVAFAATQNLKSDETCVRHKLKTVMKPAALKTNTAKKIQQAHDRKSEASNQKTAFCRKDSLKSAEVNQKQKLKQVIEPAVMKTKINQKLAAAEQRKSEVVQRKTAFARSDSLKVVEGQAKKVIKDFIVPALKATELNSKAKTARENKHEAQAAKVAFARSDSLKGEKAHAKVMDSSVQERLGQENDQKMFNAANRKANETQKKLAFARTDSEKVLARGGIDATFTFIDNECDTDTDTPPVPAPQPSSPICGLGASMTWGAAKMKAKAKAK